MTVLPKVSRTGSLAVTRRAASLVEGPWLITAAVMLATFMEVLDGTVVNVSLTHIAGSLSATTNEATWALTSYLVANGIVIPISGWLANHFGRKNLFMVSTAGFTAASLLCGIAPSMGLLVTFRVIQGACGGSLQPLSQAVMLEAFPPKQHGKAMAIWAMAAIVAPVLGPVSGWLADGQFLLALGLLHQPADGSDLRPHDQSVSERPAVYSAFLGAGRFLGSGDPGYLGGRAPDHVGQGAGRGLV